MQSRKCLASPSLVCSIILLALANYHQAASCLSRVEPEQDNTQTSPATTTTTTAIMQQQQQLLRPKTLNNTTTKANNDLGCANNATGGPPTASADSKPIPSCQLGNQSYQLGDRWNPVVPPFGVQACVFCECTFKTIKSQPGCFESKVNCRKLTAECPQLAECPDGSQPVQQQGQCCKSCPSQQARPISAASSARLSRRQARLLSLKLERIREFQKFIEAHPAGCEKPIQTMADDGAAAAPTTTISQQQYANSSANTTTSGNSSSSKLTKSNKMHESLNGIGIDTRAVFKSLQTPPTSTQTPTQTNLTIPTPVTQPDAVGRPAGAKDGDTDRYIENHHSPLASQLQQQQPTNVSSPQALRFVQNHQASNINNWQVRKNNLASSHRTTTTTISRPFAPPPCKLGNETFQVGEVWHPNLAPLGVQFCVVCNCIVKVQPNGCWESLTTCRRIEQHCRNTCRPGSELVQVDGKCCKGCSSRTGHVLAHEPVFSERTPMQDMRKYKTIVDKHPTCSGEHQTTLGAGAGQPPRTVRK